MSLAVRLTACSYLYSALETDVKMIRKLLRSAYTLSLNMMPRSWIIGIFRISGERLGVTTCTCRGDLGDYEAVLNDRVILSGYLNHHNWEPSIQHLLAELSKGGRGSFIDVGANIGLTLIPVGAAHPNIKLVGIEADKENFGCLRRNVERNDLSGVELFNVAVFSHEGELEFERSRNNAGDHRVHGRGERNLYGEAERDVVKVKCSRIDNLLDIEALPAPVGLKCDVQGAEVHFLKGAREILRSLDYLVIEYWPYGIARTESRAEEFFEILMQDFYFGAIIEPYKVEIVQLIPVADLIKAVSSRIRSGGETSHCDLLLTKISNRV